MRLVTFALRRRLSLAPVLCLLTLASCTRDLALPSPPTSPTDADFSPNAAYAGQLLRVTGSHFSSDPTGNTINFAHASARAERWEGAALVVRVPADAGAGPVTVTSREGTSAASTSAFDYLGLGEPRRLQVASSSPILQRPRAVHPVAGDVVVDSTLYGGLVWAGNSGLTTPPLELSASDVELGIVYYVFTDSLGLAQLVAVSGSTGVVTGTADLADVPHQILPLSGRNVVLTFHTNDTGQEVVAGWDGGDLTPVFAATAYSVGSFDGAADARNGHAIVAGYDILFDRFTLFRLDLTGAPAPPPAAVEFACPTGYTGACPPALGTGSNRRVPLAVANSGGGGPRAVAALDDGNVVIASLGATPPEFLQEVETFSPSAIDALAGGKLTPYAVGTKPGAGYAFAFSVDDGSLRWIVDASTPTVVATLPQPSPLESTDLAFIGSDADNDVMIVNVKTGLKVGRVSFDVGPRAAGYDGAAAFMRFGAALDGDVVFPVSTFPGLLRVPIGAGAPAVLSRTPSIDMLAASADTRILWQLTSGAPPRLDGFLGYAAGTWSSSVSVELPAAPQRLSAQGWLAVVGHDAGLSIVDGITPPAGLPPTAAIPGADLSSPSFLALGFTPEEFVWALVEVDAGTQVQLWSTASIELGQEPLVTWTVPGTALAAAWLEDGLWVFRLDDELRPVATLLDDAMVPVRTVASNDRLLAVHAISPNGRLLVFREEGSALGFVLRFFRADPDAGFPEVPGLVFDARVEGFTFDATGERLYVLTQAPDRVVTVD